MEFVIAAFLGLWLVGAGILGYIQLKKDFRDEGKDKR